MASTSISRIFSENRASHASINWQSILTIAALAILLAVLVRTAWIGDDAYITLRTVDNLVHGYGPTFNTDERVQAFTHPLWMLLLSVVYFITREAFYTTIVISVALTIGAAVFLVRYVSATWVAGTLAVLCLAVSKPFIDYSTSGLENPLTHALLAVFVYSYCRHTTTGDRAITLCLLASLLACNRLDTLTLTLPAIAYILWQLPRRQLSRVILLGFSPLIIWLLLATIYYGSPLPNTAFAKLSTGIPASELWEQGWRYLRNTALRSPVTAIVIGAGLIYSFLSRERRFVPLGIGIILNLIYIVKVGGDFMQGRFLTAAFFTSVLMLSTYQFRLDTRSNLAAAMVVLGLSFLSPTSPIYAGADYGLGPEKRDWDAGISDERAAYFQNMGMIVSSKRNEIPSHNWIEHGRSVRSDTAKVVYGGAIGMLGYYGGPDVHVIGGHALEDPLRSHLPTRTPHHWRIGHFYRTLPRGYEESIENDTNLIENTILREYYRIVRELTRNSVFGYSRLLTIVKWNLGAYSSLVELYADRTVELSAREVARPLKQGTKFNANGCHIIGQGGVCVSFDSLLHSQVIEWSVNHNDSYMLQWRNDSVTLDSLVVKAKWITGGGLRIDTLPVPPIVSKKGFDNILVLPYGRHWSQSLGHLRTLDH